MGYLTFICNGPKWDLYQGIGSEGELLKEWHDQMRVRAFDAGEKPILWICGGSNMQETKRIQRIILPDLLIEELSWNGARIGAIACAPEGERAVVIELPTRVAEQPRIWLWQSRVWERIETEVTPDISSKLAWLDSERVVFEADSRRLVILDLESRRIETGPAGCCPTAARKIGEWYGIHKGLVMRFSFQEQMNNDPQRLTGFSFGRVTFLRATNDGQVFTWKEPRFLYRYKGYVQKSGHRRKRFPMIDRGVGAVIGPYASQ